MVPSLQRGIGSRSHTDAQMHGCSSTLNKMAYSNAHNWPSISTDIQPLIQNCAGIYWQKKCACKRTHTTQNRCCSRFTCITQDRPHTNKQKENLVQSEWQNHTSQKIEMLYQMLMSYNSDLAKIETFPNNRNERNLCHTKSALWKQKAKGYVKTSFFNFLFSKPAE